MLTPTATANIRAQVAWRLDCDPAVLQGAHTHVKPHGPRLVEYHGVYVWLMGEATVISAPPAWVPVIRATLPSQTSAVLGDVAFWQATLGEHIERIVGPSYQGYVDRAAFRPAFALPREPSLLLVRRLDTRDVPLLKRLVAACPPQEWADSAIQFDHTPIFALELSGELVAAASAPDDGPGVASVGVITDPAHRGSGYGTAVVSALTADRLTNGIILHYQTLRSNGASVAVARRLGYQDLATALGIRLRNETVNATAADTGITSRRHITRASGR